MPNGHHIPPTKTPRSAACRHRLHIFALLVLSIPAAAAPATCVEAQSLTGTALAIDGDDIMLTMADGEQRVRLLGIDAPELKQTCRRAGATWACGQAARDELEKLVAGRTVTCTGRARWLLSVWRVKRRCEADGADIGERLVAAGLAVARYREYEAAQHEAQQAKRGMWAGCFADPSWWRQKFKGQMGDGC